MTKRRIINVIVTIFAVTMLLAIALVAPSTTALSASQAQAVGNNGPVSRSASGIEAAAAATYAYWTPERMASAQPMPLKETTGTGLGVDPAAAAAAAAGLHPGLAPGHLPGEDSAAIAVPQLDGIQPVSEISHYYTYPFPYTFSYMGGGLQQLPTPKTVGKLFFNQNGGSWVCSGTVVTGWTGGTNRVIDTAGHCVHDGSNLGGAHWSSSMLFCPGYWSAGSPASPWGCWSDANAWTTSQWYGSGDLRYDHGFVVASHTSNTGYGEIASVIGAQGEAWDQGSQQEIWSLGYPAVSPFTGGILIWTSSGVAQIDDVGGGAPYTWGIGSSETGGSSGGAWLIGARFSALGYVVSHNDYKYTSPSMPLAMYGPPHDSTVWLPLYNAARADNP